MANAAFKDVSFLLRPEHQEKVAKILTDPESSENDKYVALTFYVMQRYRQKESCLSVKIQVLLLLQEKKDNRFGLMVVTKKPCPKVSIKHIQKRTCVTRKMLH